MPIGNRSGLALICSFQLPNTLSKKASQAEPYSVIASGVGEGIVKGVGAGVGSGVGRGVGVGVGFGSAYCSETIPLVAAEQVRLDGLVASRQLP